MDMNERLDRELDWVLAKNKEDDDGITNIRDGMQTIRSRTPADQVSESADRTSMQFYNTKMMRGGQWEAQHQPPDYVGNLCAAINAAQLNNTVQTVELPATYDVIAETLMADADCVWTETAHDDVVTYTLQSRPQTTVEPRQLADLPQLPDEIPLPEPEPPKPPKCSIDGCDGARGTRGWCVKHYGRWRKHGDPLKVNRISTSLKNLTEEEKHERRKKQWSDQRFRYWQKKQNEGIQPPTL